MQFAGGRNNVCGFGGTLCQKDYDELLEDAQENCLEECGNVLGCLIIPEIL
jgi:hypothetical protein